jgi:hypothetical protein
MKKQIISLIFIFLSSLIISGCFSLKRYDTKGFSSSGLIIYYNQEEVAKLTAIEFSLDNGKMVKEMTFRLKNHDHSDKILNLLAFIHSKHKDWEIEIDYPITDSLIHINPNHIR